MKRKFIVEVEGINPEHHVDEMCLRTALRGVGHKFTVKPFREPYKVLKKRICLGGEPSVDDYYIDIGNGIIKNDDIPRGTDLIIFAKSNRRARK